MIVVDASLLVDFLLDEGERGRWAAATIIEGGTLHAPHLVDAEVAGGVRRAFLHGLISRRLGSAALSELVEMRVERYPAAPLLDRVWSLATTTLTAYDALYVALAEALGCPLATTDLRLARTSGHGAIVQTPS